MQSSPVGVWSLRSFDLVDTVTGEKRLPFGTDPRGSLAIPPSGRMFVVMTPSGRQPPTSVEEKAAAFDAMYAYSGQYRIEDGEFITSVDVAWFEPWVGSEQRRAYRVEGNTMTIVTAPVRSPAFEIPFIGTLVWKRET